MATTTTVTSTTSSANEQSTSCAQGDRLVIMFDAFRGNHPDDRHEDIYLPKKLAIYNVDTGGLQMWTFRSPFPWYVLNQTAMQANNFISRYVIGVNWNYGDIPYRFMKPMLLKYTKNAGEIYSKGANCCKYLTHILGDRYVMDIEWLLEDIPVSNIEQIKHSIPSMRCVMDHTRTYSIPDKFDSLDYSCCQDRAFYYGHVVRAYQSMPIKEHEAMIVE